MYLHHKKCPLCLKHPVIIITPPLPAVDRQNLAPPKICKDTSQHFKNSEQKHGDTVDGQNPAPPRMIIIPIFIGF